MLGDARLAPYWWVIGTLSAGVGAGVGVYVAPSGMAAAISAGLLAATFVAILWYSWETHQLVHMQRDGTELAEHPWLAAAWLRHGEIAVSDAAPFGGVRAGLPITNVGRTPAMLRQVTVSSPVLDRSSGWTVTLGGDKNPRTLVPGQHVIVTLAEVLFGGPTHPTLYVNVSIPYRTIHGGSGRARLRFRFANRSWKSGRTDYELTLASGQTFPPRDG